MDRDITILVSVGIYLLICVLVGIWALRRTRSSHDFFMAGRNLGVMLTAFAVFSSTLSGFGFVGGPGLVYRMGMSSVWMVVVAGIGYLVSYSLLAKRIRIMGELRNAVSLPDVVALRYNSNGVRIWVSIAILLGVLGYLATQIKAMAVVLQNILDKPDFWPGVSLEWCVLISCAVLVFYTVTGGIIASVYTDLIQGAVMVIAAGLIFFTVILTFDGGLFEMNQYLVADDPEAIGPWGTLGMVGCLSWFFVFGLGGAGQPHVVTKLMMNRKVSDARNILPVTFLGYVFSALLWIGIGLAMRALVVSGQHLPLETADAAAPAFLQTYAHPLLAGVVFAGLFAAIMSTADGFLNIGTAAVVHDLPKAFGWKVKNELLGARLTTLAISVFAALIALYSGELVAILGAFGWGTFAAALT
ncbi:MAG: sodium/proline symporter, partial [Bacteroidota bacterium]